MYSSSKTEGIIYVTPFIVISKLSLLLAGKRWGKIAVEEKETQQQKTAGNISLAFERNGNWMFFYFPPPSLLSNASVFPYLFFPFTMCSSPRLKFWHSSLSLNREDDKNLKPIPIWKGTFCQTLAPSVDVLGGDVHGYVDTDSSLLLSYSSTRNGLRFRGARDHSPAEPNAMPALSFCPLSHFSVVGAGTMGSCGPAVANTPNWLSLQCELLHPCTVAISSSGASCTPESLETHLSTIQSTSIPKHIFSLFSRYWQACYALLGWWLIATKWKGWWWAWLSEYLQDYLCWILTIK